MEAGNIGDYNDYKRRGRLSTDESQERARDALRHRDDPIWLESSPIAHTALVEQMAEERYPNRVVARGRALCDLIIECLEEIELELGNSAGVARLTRFIECTRQGKGVKQAGQAIGVSPEYASRYFQHTVVELLAEKLMLKMRSHSAPASPPPRPASKPGVRLLHLAPT
jgi:hypothetical protein